MVTASQPMQLNHTGWSYVHKTEFCIIVDTTLNSQLVQNILFWETREIHFSKQVTKAGSGRMV